MTRETTLLHDCTRSRTIITLDYVRYREREDYRGGMWLQLPHYLVLFVVTVENHRDLCLFKRPLRSCRGHHYCDSCVGIIGRVRGVDSYMLTIVTRRYKSCAR